MAKSEEESSPNAKPVTLTQELATLPLVDSMVELYDSARQSPVVGVGIQLAGQTCFTVAETLNHYCGDKVLAVNECAGGYVAAIKEKYPVVQKPTSEVVDHVIDSASRVARSSAKTVLQSLPAQTVLVGLDGVIAASIYLLDWVKPASKKRSASPRKPARFREVPNDGKSGTEKTSERTKSTQTPKKTDGILKKVKSMVRLRSVLHKYQGKKTRSSKSTGMTPEKKGEIDSRRKVSPRKRLSNSFVGRMKMTLRRFFGLGNKAISLTQADIRSYLYPEVVKGAEDSEKKRKYDDIQTDPDSEDSLAGFDIDEYQSDEDSDYEEQSDASTDSMEYEAGDTESDISFDGSKGYPQIKDKSSTPTQGATANKCPSIPKLAVKTSSSGPIKITNGTDKVPNPNSSQNGVHDPKSAPPSELSGKAQTKSSTESKGSTPRKAESVLKPAGKLQPGEKAGKDTSSSSKTGSGTSS